MAVLRRLRVKHRRAKATAVALLVCIGVMSVGAPILPTPQRAEGPAFPCQHHSCGCADAHSCWQHCCCYSDGEKLTWAMRNEVRPPDFFLARFEALPQWNDLPLCSAAVSGEHCAAHGEHKSCCSSKTPTVSNRRKKKAPPFVSLTAYWRCQGQSPLLAVFSNAVCQPRPPAWRPESPLRQSTQIVEAPLQSAELPPPTPPPRLAV